MIDYCKGQYRNIIEYSFSNIQFLAALPLELQREVLEQQRRATSTARPADIDPASLLASLPPELRSEILLEQSMRVILCDSLYLLGVAYGCCDAL